MPVSNLRWRERDEVKQNLVLLLSRFGFNVERHMFQSLRIDNMDT
jgi:hypothetical protein